MDSDDTLLYSVRMAGRKHWHITEGFVEIKFTAASGVKSSRGFVLQFERECHVIWYAHAHVRVMTAQQDRYFWFQPVLHDLTKAVVCAILSLWDGASKRSLAANRKE